MKIGFNLLPYRAGMHGGAEVYFRSIYQALRGQLPSSVQTVLLGAPDTLEAYATHHPQEILKPVRVAEGRFLRVLQEQTVLPWLAWSQGLDLLASNYVVPLVSPCATVGVVHDLLFRRYPESMERAKRWLWSLMLPATLVRSTAVVTVSEFSAGEIAALYPRIAPKVFVTVEGVRPSLLAEEVGPRPMPQPYLVCPATYGAHKNLVFLVRAFARMAARHPGLRLVLVGAARTPDARAYEAKVLAAGQGLGDRLVQTGHVTDADLAALYAHAEACVLPSLYEGYGLPVVEAQAFGCPVVCSDHASLPETAGPGALTFDPTCESSLETTLERLLGDPAVGERCRDAGRKNLERHTWNQAAQQLATAFSGALGRPLA